jgi:hypothetical protein
MIVPNLLPQLVDTAGKPDGLLPDPAAAARCCEEAREFLAHRASQGFTCPMLDFKGEAAWESAIRADDFVTCVAGLACDSSGGSGGCDLIERWPAFSRGHRQQLLALEPDLLIARQRDMPDHFAEHVVQLVPVEDGGGFKPLLFLFMATVHRSIAMYGRAAVTVQASAAAAVHAVVAGLECSGLPEQEAQTADAAVPLGWTAVQLGGCTVPLPTVVAETLLRALAPGGHTASKMSMETGGTRASDQSYGLTRLRFGPAPAAGPTAAAAAAAVGVAAAAVGVAAAVGAGAAGAAAAGAAAEGAQGQVED